MVAAGVLTPPVGGTAKTVASGAARVICEILWDHIRCRPAQCVGGTISIPARLIQDHCPGRRDAAVKRWMFANNIMRITRGYVVGKLTYLYWVNIPLVVWLLGFRKGELAWTRHASGGRTRPHDANDNAETGEAVERQTEEYMNHDHCDIGGCPRQPLGTPCDYCRHYSAAWVPKVMRASGEDGVDWARRQPAMPAVGLHELGTVEDLPPDIF